MTELISTIRKHMENMEIIIIKREQVDKTDEIVGYPINLSKKLLVISRIDDFRDDGFRVVRISDITKAYSKESDAFYGEICKKEGLVEKNIENPITNVTDFHIVLKQLLDYKKYVTIQCELEDNEFYYSIGKILTIEKDIVYFDNFDKMGLWDENVRLIPIDKITLISVEDYYSKIYYKYVKPNMTIEKS